MSYLTFTQIAGDRTLNPAQRAQRRRLMLQDAVALLSLFGITLALAVLTYFFFSSFRVRRQILEARWYERGQKAVAAGRAVDAVEDFRSALSLSPGNRTYELALAQALTTAGRTDEAYAYYSALREAKPGDGLLNLRLARLEVLKKNSAEAIAYYRAALNGDWQSEGVARRRLARLELAAYLLAQHKPAEAQAELLTAEGNALEDPAAMNQIAALLAQGGFFQDALTAYRRTLQHTSADSQLALQALLGIDRAAEPLGEYATAMHALERYASRARTVQNPPEPVRLAEATLDRLQRIQSLDPLPNLPPRERAQRLLQDASIAHKRFTACAAQQMTLMLTTPGAASLTALEPEWKKFSGISAARLAASPPTQEDLYGLIGQTEIWTNKLCGSPTGDDALLLQLATVPNRTE
jgi:tetratricopeptide (TPR) repeat protein